VTRTVSLDVALPGLALKGVRAAMLELVTLSGMVRRPFSMLLGRDVLRAVTLDVDWPSRRLRFVKPGAFAPPLGAVTAAARLRGGALMVPVQIEGAPPVELMVDTGATSDIALSDKAAERLGLLSGRAVRSAPSVSLGGMSQDRLVRAKTVTFAGKAFHDVEVQVFNPSLDAALPDGLLGSGLLRASRVAIDLDAGVMWLSRAEPVVELVPATALVQ